MNHSFIILSTVNMSSKHTWMTSHSFDEPWLIFRGHTKLTRVPVYRNQNIDLKLRLSINERCLPRNAFMKMGFCGENSREFTNGPSVSRYKSKEAMALFSCVCKRVSRSPFISVEFTHNSISRIAALFDEVQSLPFHTTFNVHSGRELG